MYKGNTRNRENILYRGLTRLLSGPITKRRRQFYRREPRHQLQKYKFTSASGAEFKKYSRDVFLNMSAKLISEQQRAERYSDFDMMMYDPILAAGLDIYADEITSSTIFQKVLKINCKNQEIKSILRELYYNVLNVEANLFYWVKTMCKYGDFFLYLDIDEEKGLTNVTGLPGREIERMEGLDPKNPNYVQFQWNSAGLTFENWQIAHFRILGDDKYVPYGSCLVGDTRVKTFDGYKEIKNLREGDFVVNFDLKKQKNVVSKVLKQVNSGKKECIKISTKHNFLDTSHEHPFLIWNKEKEKFLYKKAIDLQIGDLLVIDNKINKGVHSFIHGYDIPINKTKPSENKNGWWNSNHLVPNYIDKEFARLFGFLIGDGWIPKHNNKVSFALGEHEDLNEFYIEILRKYTGKEPIYKDSTNGSKYDYMQVEFNSKMFKTILQRMEFKGKAKTKRIPEWVFKSTPEIRESFIQGLFDADGSVFVDKWNCSRFQLELSNEQLIKDCKTLLQSLGYKTGKIGTRHKTGAKIGERQINSSRSWYFYYYSSKKTQLKKYDIGENRKEDTFIIDPIISIEDIGHHEVYDIQVENENHNFFANGIVVHNSIFDPARRIWRQYQLLKDAMMAYRIVRCIPESNIWTPDGLKNIKDVKVGDVVYSYDYNNNKPIETNVTDWINNGRQQIWEIKTQHRLLKTNFNHPVLVYNGKTKKNEYVQTCDIIPGTHKLLLPSTINTEGQKTEIKLKEENYEWFGKLSESGKDIFREQKYDKSIRSLCKEIADEIFPEQERRISQFLYKRDSIKGLPYKKANQICEFFNIETKYLDKYPKGMYNLERVSLPKYVDKEFARFFGFMIGDGFMTKNLHKIGFSTGIYPEVNKYYYDILKKYCSDAKFVHDKRNKNKNLGRVEVHSRYFASLMRDMGFTSSVYTKEIPNWVFQSSNEIKEAFIDGLIDADGHKRKQKNVESMEIELCNEKTIKGLKELCHQLNWNVSSKISTRKKAGGRKIGEQVLKETVSYSLYLTKEKSGLYENIISVTATDTYEDVYDIRVDNEFHNFIAEGCIVHNSPERRVFYLDVGNIPPEEVKQFVLDFQKELKKNQVIDTDTGRVDLRYNALSVEEDYIIPIRGNSQTRIDSLQGGQYTGDVDDVKFLQDEMLAAIKIPAAYLLSGQNGGGMEDKTTLAQKDVRFSRTIQRLQRYVVAELEKMGTIHLYTLGFRGDDLIDFDLELANPSKIAELQELEHWRTKFDVASAATEGFFSKRWVATNVFGLSEEEFIRNQREIFNDKKFELELEKIVQMTGEEIDGSFGPASDGLSGDFGEEEMMIEPPGEEMGDEGGDETLLAQPAEPAKRDDGSRKVSVKKDAYGKESHLTQGSKGKWYEPKSHDSRKSSGPRKRQTDSLWSKESSKNTKRNRPGRELLGLGSGITENQEYLLAEQEIYQMQKNILNLVEDLEAYNNDETQ